MLFVNIDRCINNFNEILSLMNERKNQYGLSIMVYRFLILLATVATALIASNCGNPKTQEIEQDQMVSTDSTDELWYKHAIIYTLDVEVFKDSDGDGTGDFNGLISRLGYIDSLGVDAIWLAPFQPTPNRDDGYDVSDYFTVDRKLGSLEQFDSFVKKAGEADLKVIMDLVVNHTSDEHPWFVEARQNENSKYHNWYVWSDDRPKNYDKGMVFPGVQEAIWSRDSVSGKYYYHRFYKFQPDLNAQNEEVQAEIKKIILFWMERGVKGFRLDGVPFFIEVPQKTGEKFDHQYEMLEDMRTYVKGIDKDAVILGEANVLPDENKNFFGENGEGMNMMFNFFANQHLFYALATGEVKPLINALNETKEIPKDAEWGQFLRNHDEVDLGRLTKKERERVYEKFGPEKHMQLYDRGIRRRLAPMMNNNRKQLELAYSVLFALPSTPVLRYGDEIGMGDDLKLKERLSVRTPMQWTDDPNAGFTSGKKPVRPVIQSPPFDYKSVNVKNQLSEKNSLLEWTKQMVRLRKSCPEISYGDWEIVDVASDNVLAIKYQWNGKHLIVIHNFSHEKERIKVDDILKTQEVKNLLKAEAGFERLPNELQLAGYDYRWYQVNVSTQAKK
jgi:maltose alpha-D-glucosyltransferase/alpha-amylase